MSFPDDSEDSPSSEASLQDKTVPFVANSSGEDTQPTEDLSTPSPGETPIEPESLITPTVESPSNPVPHLQQGPLPRSVENSTALPAPGAAKLAGLPVLDLLSTIDRAVRNSDTCVSLLHEIHDDSKSRLNDLRQEALDLRGELGEMTGQAASLQDALNKKTEVHTELQSRLDSVNELCLGLEKQTESLRRELEQATQANGQLQGRIQSLESAMLPAGSGGYIHSFLDSLTGDDRERALYHLHSIKFHLSHPDGSTGDLIEQLYRLSQVACQNLSQERAALESLRGELNTLMTDRLSIRDVSPGDPIDDEWMTGAGMLGCYKVEAVKSWALQQGTKVLRKAEIVPTK